MVPKFRISVGLGAISLLISENLHEVVNAYDTHLFRLLFVRLGLVDHLLKLGCGHIFTELISDALQVVEGDVVLFLGEQDKGLFKLGISVPLGHLGCHYVHEVVQVNRYLTFLVLVVVTSLGAVGQLRYEPFDLLLGGLKAEGS